MPSLPASRDELKEYILRRLGDPVITINVSDDQIDDRINDAFQYWWDYHYAGQDKIYYKQQLTQGDIDNKYIVLPENVTAAIRIFDMNGLAGRMNMFDIRYQIALNDLYTLTAQSMIPFYMTMQHLQFLEQILIGEKPIRFNRHESTLYLDIDWATVNVGDWLIVEAYQNVDPDLYPDCYSDRWLLQYATALVKRQWGSNIKKFGGMQMPGGVIFNGQEIFDEAEREIAELEEKIINDYSLPIDFQIG